MLYTYIARLNEDNMTRILFRNTFKMKNTSGFFVINIKKF